MSVIPAEWSSCWFALFRRSHAQRGYCVIDDGHFLHLQMMEIAG